MIDALLDASVVASFDATGYRRHARRFTDGPWRDLTGRTVLITGGTAGIGLAAAHQLAARGARAVLWGRDADRGAQAAAEVPGATAASVDMADLDAVVRYARALPADLAGIVLNAGAMPLERTVTRSGRDVMWASQVLGHMSLLRTLRDRGTLPADARAVWVSSGGGLSVRLRFDGIDGRVPYQRHSVYAAVKRAQMVLTAELATRWPDLWVGAMHPGWVDTAAVRHSMPTFHRLLRHRLRDGDQGADTITWLVAAADPGPSGRLWFDRALAEPYPLPGTRERPADRARLWDRVVRESASPAS